jgi:hypothetical protein
MIAAEQTNITTVSVELPDAAPAVEQHLLLSWLVTGARLNIVADNVVKRFSKSELIRDTDDPPARPERP